MKLISYETKEKSENTTQSNNTESQEATDSNTTV